ncbi:MAG: hypothetical protein ACTH8X_08155 [Corynebacterium variabile]
MVHSHDSCAPDLARDLAVTGAVDFRAASAADIATTAPDAETLTAPQRVSPVVAITPLSLPTEVIARSAQVPVVVILGSPVDPEMSALRRELTGAASSAGLRWILAVADTDRFPRLVAAFRPVSMPTVEVVADGTGIAAWTPEDGLGENGVDCADWVSTVVGRVAHRLAGLPPDTLVDDAEAADVRGKPGNGPDAADSVALTSDPRLRQAADLVGSGDPEGAVALYETLLAEYPDLASQQVLQQARVAVGVLVRTKELDQRAVYTTLAGAQRLLDAGDAVTGTASMTLDDLLRTADVLVLDDRPVDAVDLLSGALSNSAAGRPAAECEQLRVRVLDVIRHLEPGASAAERARRRLASALF